MNNLLALAGYFVAILLIDFLAHSWGYIYNADRARSSDEQAELRKSVRYNLLDPLRLVLAACAAGLLAFFPNSMAGQDYGLILAIPFIFGLVATTVWRFIKKWRQAAHRIDSALR
jgi:hypothetical protein